MNNLEIVKNKFKNDRFAAKFGIIFDDLTETSVKMHMKLTEEMNNLFDRPHGGAMYALADAAFSVLGNNDNNLSVALDCDITYHSSPDPGEVLFVEGKIVAQSKRVGSYWFELYTLKSGAKTLMASMKSTLYRTGKPIAE